MKLGEIDLDLKPIQRSLYLCRPDKTTISSLKDIYGLKYNMKLGKVDELSFTIPTQVERNHELIDNPLIEEIKHRYLFKLIYNHQTSYFIFNERNKEYGDNETISYRAYGLGYQLADKDIRDYEATSKSLTEMLYDVLSTSNWKIGYVDGYFDTKIRSHEIPSSTVLQAVYDLAEKFNAVIIWDTVNLKINMYNPSNIGMDKGLRLKEGKYLESFSLTDNSEEVITRLKIYGQDGLTIRRLTPTGANYLEDFSYYVHPFKRDATGKVLQSSDYMSDSLAIALEDYNVVLARLQGDFDAYLVQLLAKQDELQKEGQRLSVLLADLIRIIDERDIFNSTGDGNIADINSRLNSKESQISASESLINGMVAQEKAIQANIDALRVQTSMEAHLSGAQLLELNQFIVIKEYTNDMIVDDKDLLKDGIEAFMKFREPQINLSMNVHNFLSNIESQNDHNKLGLGDTITTRNSRLQVDIKAKLIEIEFDFDNDSINLQIANERDISDSEARFLEMIYAANNTSNVVNMNKFKWGLVEELDSMVSQMLTGHWDANKQMITAGYEQNITISERGIIVKSPQNPMDWLVIQNGMLALTNDGGKNWKHAIKSTGIVGDVIIGRLLIGSRLLIEDVNGIIKITGSEMTVYDPQGNEKVILGKYDGNKYGIKINSGSIDIVGGLTGDNISQSYTDSIAYDDGGIRRDLRLTSPLPNSISLNSEGITAYTASTSNFARLDYRGLYVQGGAVDIRSSAMSNRGVIINGTGISAYNGSGIKTFYVDTLGNLTATTGSFSGNITGATGTFSGALSGASGSFRGDITGSNGTFSGNLSAVGGTFSGNLSGVSGTFVSLTSGTISGATISGTTITSVGGGNTTSLASGVFTHSNSWGQVKIVNGAGEFRRNDKPSTFLTVFGDSIVQYSDNRSFSISHDGLVFRDPATQSGYGSTILGGAFVVRGSLDFSGATVTGINTTAVFG